MDKTISDVRKFAVRALRKRGIPASIAEPGPRESSDGYVSRVIAHMGAKPPPSPISRETALQTMCHAAGELVQFIERDDSGRKIKRFYGPPSACWDAFKEPARLVVRINGPGNNALRGQPGYGAAVAEHISKYGL